MEDLNYDTINGYRNSHRTLKEGHPFERLNDHEYLRSIGAAAVSEEDGKLHPTAAGMLMFGNEYDVVRHFPEYFLDYREEMDSAIRWTDRLQSSSGEWSGNVCDFYFRVYNKIIKDIKVPFKMVGGERVDDTPVHKALREALANCLINADYHGVRGVVIRKETDKIKGKLSIGAGRLKYQDIPKESFAYTVTTVIAGEVYERLYRGASSRNRILYY